MNNVNKFNVGAGSTRGSREAVANYLVGTMSRVSGSVKGQFGERAYGPGKVFRDLVATGFPLFVFPFLFWSVLVLFYNFRAVEQDCVSVFGYDVRCKEVVLVSWYTMYSAVVHTVLIAVCILFEGDGAPLGVHVPIVCVGTLFGVILSFWYHSVGTLPIIFGLLLVNFDRGTFGSPFYRWLSFIFVCFGLGLLVNLLELAVTFYVSCLGDVPEEIVDGDGVFYFPHPYINVTVADDMLGTSRHYFKDKGEGGGMTDKERVLALQGDRFLKLLVSEELRSKGLPVSFVPVYEGCQTDDALFKWVNLKCSGVCGGKKSVASFAEVLWGEVFGAYRAGHLTFEDVFVAFDVFQKEVASASGLVFSN